MATGAAKGTATHRAGITRRRVIAGAAGVSAVLAACAPGGGTGGSGGGAQPPVGAGLSSAMKTATLEGWAHSDARYEWQIKALEDYNKEKGSSVKINWTKKASAGEVADNLVVTLAAGSGFPDVCDVEISQMGKLLKTTPPLVAFNDALRGRQNEFFMPSFVDPWSLQGKWYGLGNELNTVLLTYRHDLFDKAGVKGPLKTWDDVIDAGKRLTAAQVTHGISFLTTGTAGHFHVLSIIGGGGYLENGNKLTINHQANQRALQYLVDLAHKHKAGVLEADVLGAERDAAYNAGKVGGDIGPSWRISGTTRKRAAADTNGRWMVQHMPQWSGTARTTTSWGGTGMTVLKDSKFKDVGVDFVVWEHVTPKASLYDYDLRQVYPVLKKAYEDPRLNEGVPWFNNQKVGIVLKEAADAMKPFSQGLWWPDISGAAGKHVTAAMKNEKPVKQALDEAQAEAKAAIETAGGRIDSSFVIQGS